MTSNGHSSGDTGDDHEALREGLLRILKSRGTTSKHQLARASAARTLARLNGQRPEPPKRAPAQDAEEEMARVIEQWIPDIRRQLRENEPADPMRDLEPTMRALDPRVWSWLPVAVPDMAAAEAEILAAADRLGFERGPYPAPGEGY